MAIQMKAIDKYFPVVFFKVILYYAVQSAFLESPETFRKDFGHDPLPFLGMKLFYKICISYFQNK